MKIRFLNSDVQEIKTLPFHGSIKKRKKKKEKKKKRKITQDARESRRPNKTNSTETEVPLSRSCAVVKHKTGGNVYLRAESNIKIDS